MPAETSNITLYDLVGRDRETFWSSNVWKTRFALHLKDLEFETVPLSFCEIHKEIPLVMRPTVPVLVDRTNPEKPARIQDSWNIAEYLEKTYPDRPSLFHKNETFHQFWDTWVPEKLNGATLHLIALDIWKKLDPESQVYFRKSREERLGRTLESLEEDKPRARAKVKEALTLFHQMISEENYLSGDYVGYSDFIMAALFIWVEHMNPQEFEETYLKAVDDDKIRQWWERMQRWK
ncbi:hypothetical protein BZG36_05042 [Bifiguratus adelaidae]|uniref:GST N-terminal domain-containing protein n=1 Tax=Bifiguratus adelaidae TaxID=1938954 RepID=A0A261XU60_9FUNG|nr:hypothetical protein BZG36_05042 [Bifiguratus adelaidae]